MTGSIFVCEMQLCFERQLGLKRQLNFRALDKWMIKYLVKNCIYVKLSLINSIM